MAPATVNDTSEMIAVMHEITLRYCPCQFSRSGNCRVSMDTQIQKKNLAAGPDALYRRLFMGLCRSMTRRVHY